jgi:hypothetical protein|nr:NYN domain-containing protein [Gloeotrichia echinulata DEX184]
MKCPRCESTSYRKNGRRNGKQNYLCKNCSKQFLEPEFPQPLESVIITSSNGRAKTPLGEAAAQTIVQELPQDDPTEKSGDSLGVTLAEELLQTLFSSEYLESSAFTQFIQKIQQKSEIKPNLDPGISLLLLDAENIKLDANTELFLATICQCPLKVKIAFANWRNPSTGKQDVELYERGYQLVHVPGGKDSADAKMIALGACILRYYPTVQEVFVCSGDGILIHLCNELQNQGLTVYWVRRQGQILQVENRNTGKSSHYSLAMAVEIPSFEEVVHQIQDLIKTEQESLNTRLNNLVAVANLFQERRNINNNKPPNNEIIPIPEEISTSTQNPDYRISADSVNILSSATDNINSQEILEKILIQIIKEMYAKSPNTKLSVSKLGTELQKICGQSPSSVVKKLKLGSSFTKFLQSSATFNLHKNGKEYEVALSKI